MKNIAPIGERVLFFRYSLEELEERIAQFDPINQRLQELDDPHKRISPRQKQYSYVPTYWVSPITVSRDDLPVYLRPQDRTIRLVCRETVSEWTAVYPSWGSDLEDNLEFLDQFITWLMWADSGQGELGVVDVKTRVDSDGRLGRDYLSSTLTAYTRGISRSYFPGWLQDVTCDPFTGRWGSIRVSLTNSMYADSAYFGQWVALLGWNGVDEPLGEGELAGTCWGELTNSGWFSWKWLGLTGEEVQGDYLLGEVKQREPEFIRSKQIIIRKGSKTSVLGRDFGEELSVQDLEFLQSQFSLKDVDTLLGHFGIDVFSPDFYTDRGLVVRKWNAAVPKVELEPSCSFEEYQRRNNVRWDGLCRTRQELGQWL